MSTYKVVRNYCTCHPETCGCNSWKVINMKTAERISTHYNKEDADLVVDLLKGAKDE